MYKQNGEQTLKSNTWWTWNKIIAFMQSKNIIIIIICQMTTWYTTQVYTSKIYWEHKYSSIVVCFLDLHLILTIFFSVIVNIPCTFSI